MKKIGLDKWKHFGVCLIASIVSPWLAVGLALGKEYGDSKAVGNKWDWMDIVADAVGVLIGTMLRILFMSWLLW